MQPEKPKLLILAQWFTPGYKAGGPIRSIVNLVELLKNDFTIYVLTADRDHGDKHAYADIAFSRWLNKEGVYIFYTEKANLNIPFFKKVMQELQPQAVFLNSMFAPRFFLLPLIALKQMRYNGRIILAPRGMLRASALKFKRLKKMIFLATVKRLGLLNGLRYQATNQEEAEEIFQILHADKRKIHIVENVPFNGGRPHFIEKEPGSLKIIFLGRIHPIKGLDFLLDTLQEIKENIELEIVGAIEDPEYYALCACKIKTLPSNVQVTMNENMPFEEVIDRLYANHFLVLPTRGENFGHAIFEAFAAGRPVMISDQTPWRNLDEKEIGWDISLNDIPAFVKAIKTAVSFDQNQFDTYSIKAKQFAENYISRSDLKEKYADLFGFKTPVSQL